MPSGSGFWDTPLDRILQNLGIKTVLFAGVNTDQCVLHSLTGMAYRALWSIEPPGQP